MPFVSLSCSVPALVYLPTPLLFGVGYLCLYQFFFLSRCFLLLLILAPVVAVVCFLSWSTTTLFFRSLRALSYTLLLFLYSWLYSFLHPHNFSLYSIQPTSSFAYTPPTSLHRESHSVMMLCKKKKQTKNGGLHWETGEMNNRWHELAQLKPPRTELVPFFYQGWLYSVYSIADIRPLLCTQHNTVKMCIIYTNKTIARASRSECRRGSRREYETVIITK